MKEITRDRAGTELIIEKRFKGILRDLKELNKLRRWVDNEKQRGYEIEIQ